MSVRQMPQLRREFVVVGDRNDDGVRHEFGQPDNDSSSDDELFTALSEHAYHHNRRNLTGLQGPSPSIVASSEPTSMSSTTATAAELLSPAFERNTPQPLPQPQRQLLSQSQQKHQQQQQPTPKHPQHNHHSLPTSSSEQQLQHPVARPEILSMDPLLQSTEAFNINNGSNDTPHSYVAASPPSLWSSSDDEGGGFLTCPIQDYDTNSNFPSNLQAIDDGEDRSFRRTPSATSAPKMVGRFLIGAKIGEGAYATVREGLHMDTLRIVAVKIVDLRRLRKVRGAVENVKLEIRVQKALKRHPNIIELIGVQEDSQRSKMYMFLEMANGCTLQELLEKSPQDSLPPSQVAFFLNQTLAGLLYMHRRGVVHRDIKPSNLMLTATGELKIADFGVAEFLDKYDSEDNVTRTSGSPAFQAPEIAKGDHGYSGMKVDVWAMGVTAYYLLVGRIPFHGDNLVALFHAITVGKYEEPLHLGSAVCDALKKMLEVDWHKRVTVEELLKDPWIARANRMPSPAKQEEDGWVAITCKQFSVLDLAQRLVTVPKTSEGTVASVNSLSRSSLDGNGERPLPPGLVGRVVAASSQPSDPSVVLKPAPLALSQSELAGTSPGRPGESFASSIVSAGETRARCVVM